MPQNKHTVQVTGDEIQFIADNDISRRPRCAMLLYVQQPMNMYTQHRQTDTRRMYILTFAHDRSQSAKQCSQQATRTHARRQVSKQSPRDKNQTEIPTVDAAGFSGYISLQTTVFQVSSLYTCTVQYTPISRVTVKRADSTVCWQSS